MSELAHVRAAGGERHAPDLAVGRLGLQPLHDGARSAASGTRTGRSGPAPEIVAPTAPSSSARSTSSIERG